MHFYLPSFDYWVFLLWTIAVVSRQVSLHLIASPATQTSPEASQTLSNDLVMALPWASFTLYWKYNANALRRPWRPCATWSLPHLPITSWVVLAILLLVHHSGFLVPPANQVISYFGLFVGPETFSPSVCLTGFSSPSRSQLEYFFLSEACPDLSSTKIGSLHLPTSLPQQPVHHFVAPSQFEMVTFICMYAYLVSAFTTRL